MSVGGNPMYQVLIQSSNVSDPRLSVNVRAPIPESFMYDTSAEYEAPFTQGMTGNAMIDTLMRVGVGAKLVSQSMTAQIWQGSTETELGLELEFHAEVDPDAEVRKPILQLMRLVTPSTDIGGLLTSPGPKLDSIILSQMKQVGKDVMSSLGMSSFFEGTGDAPPGSVQKGLMGNPERSFTNGMNMPNKTTSASESETFGTKEYFKKRIKDQITIQIGNYAIFDSVVITNVQKTYTSLFDSVTGLPFHAKVSIRFKPLFMIVQADLDQIFYPPPVLARGMGTRSSVPGVGGLMGIGTADLIPGGGIGGGLGIQGVSSQGASTAFPVTPQSILNPVPLPLGR